MTPAHILLADAAGPLPAKAAAYLACCKVPDRDGNLVMLDAETWQSTWRLMHIVKAIDYVRDHHPAMASPDAIVDLIVDRMAGRIADPMR